MLRHTLPFLLDRFYQSLGKPAEAEGTEEEKLDFFRRVHNETRDKPDEWAPITETFRKSNSFFKIYRGIVHCRKNRITIHK